jgi:GNAT superfamily N-acetyltransferase
MTATAIRDFTAADRGQVDELAVSAFEQYRAAYSDWPAFRARIANMSALADGGEIIVAEENGHIVGAVAYIAAQQAKSAIFLPEWPIMRMLVVAPRAQGQGIGRTLAQECLQRARRDGAGVFALHTSELMQVALPMYLRMGFRHWSDAPSILGVKYAVYVKDLAAG